jgi:hypothetical protein
MERKRINASTIRSVGYEPGGQLLEIEFSIEENFSGKRVR